MGSNYTIKQIAELAGVHRSTVDKVLHNRPGVRPEVRAHVKKVLSAVDYKPNILGRALKQQDKKKRIGVILLNTFSLHMMSEGVKQANQEFSKFGLTAEIYQTNFWDVTTQSDTINRLIDEKIDGLIVQPLNRPEVVDAIGRAMEHNIPVITTNSDLSTSKRMCYVGQNHTMAARTAARMAAEMMHGKGRLAIISGLYDLLQCITERSTEFQNHLSALAPDIEFVKEIKTMDDEVYIMKHVMDLLTETKVDYLFQTSGGVEWTAKAIQLVDAPTKIICFDTYPATLQLIRDGAVRCTIGQELEKQTYQPIKILFDYLYYDFPPESDCFYTAVDIRVPENIDIS